jgi:heme A synthase
MAESMTMETVKETGGKASPGSPVTLSPCHKVPAWLRIWAICTACAALPLVAFGAEVTTKNVGMADPVGFRSPTQLSVQSGDAVSQGLAIEHRHRLAGFVIGTACIVLALGLALQARGWLHRSLGWFALAFVGLQGILGIYRVNLNALMGPSLALVHGCFAQLVFAFLVAVAVMCSRAWHDSYPLLPRSLRTFSVGLCLLVYIQVVFGALLRHWMDPIALRLHVLLAFAVVVAVLWLASRMVVEEADRPTRRLGYLLAALVLVQPILGVEAWIGRFGTAELPELVPSSLWLDLVRSGHQILGTLIFATSVALAVLLHRRVAVSEAVQQDSPAGRLCHGIPEGTA